MTACSCGWVVPFTGCSRCPPQPVKCPRCGGVVWVERMSDEEHDEIVEQYERREPVVVNLGDFKPRR